MKHLVTIFLLMAVVKSYGQHIYSGTVVESGNGKPVRYASVRLSNSPDQYSANSDGKFLINSAVSLDNDTLIISSVGYSKRKVPVRNLLKENPKILLQPLTYQLHEINVQTRGNINFPYELFSDLLNYYRKFKDVQRSKVYYSFMSQCNGLPLELIEGYFTGLTSPVKGIPVMSLKNGRIGVCPGKFYSLNTTDILTHLQPLSPEGNQNIPPGAGNMSVKNLKKNYRIQIIKSAGENNARKYILEMVPVKDSTAFLSGTAWVNRSDMTIEKLQYTLNSNKFFYLSPQITGDKVDSIKISVEYIFDNSDPGKPLVSQIFLSYSFRYFSQQLSDTMKINSEASLLCYNFEDAFLPVLPTGFVENLPNDYQKISCLPYDSLVWQHCSILTQSEQQKFFIEYFATNGILINFPSTLDSVAGKEYVRWRPTGFLKEYQTSGIALSPTVRNLGKREIRIPEDPRIICKILLNPVKIGDSLHLSSMTFFDRKNSLYPGKRTYSSVMYVNLIFDLYELKRREIIDKWNQINKTHLGTLQELKDLYSREIKNLEDTLRLYNKETQQGAFAEGLMTWYQKISGQTGVKRDVLIKGLVMEWPALMQQGKR